MSYREWEQLVGPPWLQRDNAKLFLGEMGGAIDDQRGRLSEATKASFPQYGPSDALPPVGRDRRLQRGLAETDAAYAIRLIAAWGTWALAGSHGALLRQLFLQGLSPYIMTRAGWRSSLVAGNEVFVQSNAWTFDWRPAEFYNQFGLLFPTDVPTLTVGSQLAATVNALAATWKPAKAMFMGTWIVTGTPVWGWPTTRNWGTDNWASGGSRFIPPPS